MNGQDCDLPLLSSFENPSVDGVTISWLDFNSTALWDIEFGLKGFVRNQIPDVTNIAEKTFTFSGLESGSTYEVYIRSICVVGTSDWNGPYFFNTVIEQGNACNLGLAISDDRCPIADVFLIEVDGYDNFALGQNIVLEQVELLIAHPWPPDLQLNLMSPDGIEVPLSIHNGNIGGDNYGDITQDDCAGALVFSDNACETIADAQPPFVGIFRPEGLFSTLSTGASPNGQWELHVCDRASGDIGTLEHIALEFSESACIVPPSFRVVDTESTNITLSWDDFINCETLEIVFRKVNDPIQLSSSRFVVCEEMTLTITDLEPNETYVLQVTSSCGTGGRSPESCETFFSTTCANSLHVENFDIQQPCELSCEANCNLNSIWRNANSNLSDWLVNSGPTPTSFTGPSSDARIDGQYAYIENQNSRCPEATSIHLISQCLTNIINDTSCDLSFSYHMFGRDIGRLAVESSTDSTNWITHWEMEGDQGDEWQNASVDISESFVRGLLRISAYKPDGSSRGDIAIDNIKLLSFDTITPLTFYADLDGDGFGDPDKALLVCSNSIPDGFAQNGLDCDDNSGDIYPGAPEIQCNQIDENCNGDDDDSSAENINYIVGSILSESCVGLNNGSISIQAFNGQSPYSYQWSDGQSGSTISNLSTGIYFCTISDVGGCQVFTEPIFVGFDDIIVYSVRQIGDPSCFGVDDGFIEILLEGGTPPYSILWNNGRRGSRITQLADGSYNATISDALNCSVTIDSIELIGPQILTSGVVLSVDNDCYLDSTGFIQIDNFGGVPPYNIKWSTGAETNIISNLGADIYSVTVTDQNGCQDVINEISITQPDSITIAINNIENISCHGERNSLVDISIQGGTEPFSYFWSDGSNSQDLVNKIAGQYSVTVTDINSCISVLNGVVINEPEEIKIELDSLVNVNCIGSETGFVQVSVTGGNSPYLYNWGIFDGNSMQSERLSALSPGQYSLTVVDAFNCKSTAYTAEVVNIDVPIEIGLDIIADVACDGDSTGIVLAQVSNGVLPLDYNWSNGQKTISTMQSDTLKDVIAGSYNLTITDNEGCIGITDSITVFSNEPLEFSVDEIVDNLCFNDVAGIISISLSGASPPYSIIWNNGMSTETISNLENESYSATITDNFNCTEIIGPFEITSPSKLELEADIVNPGSNGLGLIALDVIGGNGPYTFMWDSPIQFEDDEVAEDLLEGSYSVTIIDSNGCQIDSTFHLQTSAVTNIGKSIISLYPNPSNGHFIITTLSTGSRIRQIHIYSSEGKMLENRKINSYSVDVAIDYPSGLYLIEIVTSDGTRQLKKVVIY